MDLNEIFMNIIDNINQDSSLASINKGNIQH
jgi:hypothetical protein